MIYNHHGIHETIKEECSSQFLQRWHQETESKTQVLLEKVDRTLEASRLAQEALNRDLDMKDVAFGIDQTCLVL